MERYAFRVGLTPDSRDDRTTFPFVFEEVIGIEFTNAFEFNSLIGMDILGQCDLKLLRTGECSLMFG